MDAIKQIVKWNLVPWQHAVVSSWIVSRPLLKFCTRTWHCIGFSFKTRARQENTVRQIICFWCQSNCISRSMSTVNIKHSSRNKNPVSSWCSHLYPMSCRGETILHGSQVIWFSIHDTNHFMQLEDSGVKWEGGNYVDMQDFCNGACKAMVWHTRDLNGRLGSLYYKVCIRNTQMQVPSQAGTKSKNLQQGKRGD